MEKQSLDSVVQEGLLVDRKWLKEKGFDRSAVDYYLRSDRLEAVAHGVYRKPGPPLKWQNAVFSLSVLGYQVHVGHKTALNYHGHKHYLAYQRNENIHLYSVYRLPSWIFTVKLDSKHIQMKHNPFTESNTGLIEVPFGTWDWPIMYSSAERAFLELTSTITTAEEIRNAEKMLEGAVSIRPSLMQKLLEECRQVKAKRLFLWMAREQQHPWYRYIDQKRVDLGTGKRQIVKSGILDKEFLITVPRKDEDGQEKPLF